MEHLTIYLKRKKKYHVNQSSSSGIMGQDKYTCT